ncbi:MAG: hypothetical protein QNJ45_12820 [Ardenticatenaceae bacterium]|nr:hypothetical protein [Ardenticatenaceae bacterium]
MGRDSANGSSPDPISDGRVRDATRIIWYIVWLGISIILAVGMVWYFTL